jgi:soluble lytic murein transglycosylase-like protein
MPRKNRKSRLIFKQQESSKARSARRPRSARRSGKLKVVLALVLILVLGLSLVAGYLALHSYVIDLRVGRAQKLARRVLAQTSLPGVEQDRYALAIARSSVIKDLNPAVVAAIVVVESGGNPLAVGPSGDLGLMQVNVRIHSRVFNFEESNLLNPEQNIAVGTSILKGMVLRHGNDNAIAAYNGLSPEKHDYTARVQGVLSQAGLNPQTQQVVFRLSLREVISDWLEVLISHRTRQGKTEDPSG